MRGHASRSALRNLIVALLALSGGAACACSVPVFRYALERWTSDTYQVVVFYDGQLTAEQQAVVDRLGPEGEAGERFANVEVHAVDVKSLESEKDSGLLELWNAEQTDELPRMAVYYPPNSLARGRVWSGPPTTDAVDRLLDSPARREAARRILKGETAVWIFLDGGDEQRDDEKFQVLQQNLRKAESTLKLPEVEQQDVTDGLLSIDPAKLKVRFSAIRLSRDDPQEAIFIQMLLNTEKDLQDEEFAGEPVAFPLFGRCRSLYALVGDGIAEGTLLEACAFLIGPCTCEVKAQNEHGVDMLAAVDWDGLIEPAASIDKELPPLSGLGAFTVVADKPADGESEQHNEPTPQAAATDGSSVHGNAAAAAEARPIFLVPILLVVGLVGLGIIGVICGGIFFLTRKS